MTEPKVWGDMTPEEKGALLLAQHEGKEIEWSNPRSGRIFNGWNPCGHHKAGSYDKFCYRVKPESKVERVEMYFCMEDSTFIHAAPKYRYEDTHRITFNLVDGEPDCNSIQMEVL